MHSGWDLSRTSLGDPESRQSCTGRAQLEGQNLGCRRNPEVLLGGGDPGGVEPLEIAKVGDSWLLERCSWERKEQRDF